MLLVKEHLALDPDDETRISSLRLRTPELMDPGTSMFDALNTFQAGRSHMALITPHVHEVSEAWREGRDLPAHVQILGVCTIEDVIEELIGEEVLDELDTPKTDGEAAVAARSAYHTGGGAPGTSERALAEGFGPRDPLLPP